MKYRVTYQLFGTTNNFDCECYGQYSTFIYVMQMNFGEQFKIDGIINMTK